uniref:Uncharacterized protein n=1 Tax=Timema poppense TaxID=170557 RepID=A0A7R9DGE3_TIMPO|nr:unnamed protein product [Timema poppensis]
MTLGEEGGGRGLNTVFTILLELNLDSSDLLWWPYGPRRHCRVDREIRVRIPVGCTEVSAACILNRLIISADENFNEREPSLSILLGKNKKRETVDGGKTFKKKRTPGRASVVAPSSLVLPLPTPRLRKYPEEKDVCSRRKLTTRRAVSQKYRGGGGFLFQSRRQDTSLELRFKADKKKQSYIAAMRILKDECEKRQLQLQPLYIGIDFEQALLGAIRALSWEGGRLRIAHHHLKTRPLFYCTATIARFVDYAACGEIRQTFLRAQTKGKDISSPSSVT